MTKRFANENKAEDRVSQLERENRRLVAALDEAVGILEEIKAQGVLLGSETEPPSLYTLGRITALLATLRGGE